MKMKLAALFLAVATGFSLGGAVNAKMPQQSGGTLVFSGSLTDGPCAVQATAIGERIVTLQQVRESYLLTPGKPAGQLKIFHVLLHDCNVTVYTNAAVSFSGQTDSTFKSVLVNDATDEAAVNVGLQLYGPDGSKIIPDDSSSIQLSDGFNIIPLSIDYVPVGLHPKAGKVSSTVTFNIVYS